MTKRHYKGYSIRKKGNAYQILITYQTRKYYYTYHAPEQLTESKKYAEAEKEAIRLRDNVRMGFTQTMPTFGTYAQYVIQTKKDSGVRKSTLNQYKYLLPRLLDEFSDDLLDHITPARLNKFYGALAESEVMISASALAIPGKLKKYLKANNITYRQLHEMADIAENTVSLAVGGTKVASKTAERLCMALELDMQEYFYLISNSRPISNKTLHEHIALLNTIMKTAVKERIISYNPVDGSSIPKKEKPKVNYYQPEEIAHIWECLSKEDARWQIIVTLLIVTGCRRGEIVGIKWSDILWEHNLLHIAREVLYNEVDGMYIEESNKNIDEKYVQIDQVTAQQLKEYYDSFVADMEHLRLPQSDWPQYCFWQATDSTKPLHPSSVNQFLTRFSERYGIRNINPHSLRHSLASALIAEGVDIYAVSRQLGHKQVSTTREIYAHQINEHQAKIAERIPEIYNRPNKRKKEP